MPIYEYRCGSCDRILEAIQKTDEPSPVTCPRCGKRKLKKQTSLNSFQLKGSGWYRDGYGGESGNGATKNNSIRNQSRAEQKPNKESPAA